jgi:hypothetical protein
MGWKALKVVGVEVTVSDWSLLLNYALLYGLRLSLVLTAILIVSGAVALDMFVRDYPPDIQQKYGPMSPRAARLRPFVAGVFFIAVLVVPILGLFALRAQAGSVPFIPALVFSGVALLVFNIYDLIVLDWLFFCTIQPRSMVLPGTEGMPGYRDYRFHFIGFLKGLGFCTVGALVIALLWLAAQGMAA